MPKSTIFFAVLSLVLAACLILASWWLYDDLGSDAVTDNLRTLGIGLPIDRDDKRSRVVRSRSALVWDSNSGVIYFEENGFERRPIASITKLMTAMVALDYGLDWEQQMTFLPEENVIGGRLLLHGGETVSVRDLWYASLMGSANNATLALVRSLGIDSQEFVRAMNRKAIELGLEQTTFSDVTGLDSDNLSTSYEVARLAEAAFRDYPAITETTSRDEYAFVVGSSGREHTIRNSNKLIVDEQLVFNGGKTGYLHEAGWCLVVQGSGIYEHTIAVVLGSPDELSNMQDIKTLLYSEYPH